MAKKYDLFTVPEISSIQDMLVRSARVYGNKTALKDLNPTLVPEVSYEGLLNSVRHFGEGLKSLGITERTHIALIGENRTQWGIAYLTAMSYNYVIVPIDRNLSPNEILNILYESDSEAVIFSEMFYQLFSDKGESIKRLKHFICMDKVQPGDGFLKMMDLIETGSRASSHTLPAINADDVAEIIFTSGSLGRAKGVMLTQKNLTANLMAMTKMINIRSEDRFLSVLPIHHTYECTCGFLCPMYCGSTVYYARSLKTVVEDLQASRATILLAVPLLYDKMFKKIHKGITEDKVKSKIVPPLIKVAGALESVGWKSARKKIFKELHARFGGAVRLFIAGGAAPDPAVAKGLREFGFHFVQGYGLTETAPILALNREDAFKDDAAGLPLPGIQIKINNPDADGVGEIYAQGPSVMPGYYKNEAMTKDTFDGPWFKTGDLGYIDEDGFLHISGRKKNVIISKSGKNVFPEEIEDILKRSPFILESLVYGEEDEKHDEIIAVQIVPEAEALIELAESKQTSITPEFINKVIGDVVKEANKELSSYKQIRKFYIREKEFEKTTTQKIKRYLVQSTTPAE